MNSKLGMFSVLLLGIMMLLIPASSLANAQEYDQYYEQDRYYDGVYRDDNYKKSDYEKKPYKKKDNDKKSSDEPVIIIKNEPIQKKEKKEKKESPMLLVKKELLFCDLIANGTNIACGFTPIALPDSDRYVQECTADNLICNNVNEDFFDITVTDNVEFPSSGEGTKLNFNGERFTVTEEFIKIGTTTDFISSKCQQSGFDEGLVIPLGIGSFNIGTCVIFEGECTGIVQDGELKECTVKNYVVLIDD